jgi:hypothetical protein
MVGFVALSFIERTAKDEPAGDDRRDIARIDRSASTITRSLTPPQAPVIGEDERMIADNGCVPCRAGQSLTLPASFMALHVFGDGEYSTVDDA